MVGAVLVVATADEWGDDDVQLAMGDDDCVCVTVTVVRAGASESERLKANKTSQSGKQWSG